MAWLNKDVSKQNSRGCRKSVVEGVSAVEVADPRQRGSVIYVIYWRGRLVVNLRLACHLLMKLATHLWAIAGMPLDWRRASRLVLFTPLKAPFRSKATNVTIFCPSHARSVALAKTSRAYSLVRPRRPPNWVSGRSP